MINRDPRQLPVGTRLHWYEILSVLGQGGFGITYLALDSNLHHHVAIKEYFPMGIATRDDGLTVVPNPVQQSDYDYGLARFLDEGRTLVRFDHSAIVRVTSVFEANGTAYLVMRYEQGRPLSAVLEQQNTLTEPDLRAIALALIDGLAQVHQAGFIHRDIKPANIYIRDDGTPVLLDFGSARQALGSHTQTLTTMVSAGYAPYEQYMTAAEHQGPWTDIYAIGATLYRAASGTAPMAALDRGKAIVNGLGDYLTPLNELVDERYSKQFVSAVMHALAFQESDRPQSLAAFRDELLEDSTVPAAIDEATDAADDNTCIPTNTVEDAPTEVWQPGDRQVTTEVAPGAETTGGRLTPYVVIVACALGISIVGGFLLAKWPSMKSERPVSAEINVYEPPARLDGPAKQTSVAELLSAASRDIEALRLTTPVGDNAYEKYREVLSIESGNSEAAKGIERIAVRYLQLARNAAKEERWESMFDYLEKARDVAPSNQKIRTAERRLRSIVERAGRQR